VYNTIQYTKFVTHEMSCQLALGRIGGAGSYWWQMGIQRLKNWRLQQNKSF